MDLTLKNHGLKYVKKIAKYDWYIMMLSILFFFMLLRMQFHII